MYIYPRRPLMTILVNLVEAARTIEGLVRGILKVQVINTSFAVTQSGTWTVGVNSWTASGTVNTLITRSAQDRSRDVEQLNCNFASSYISRKAVT